MAYARFGSRLARDAVEIAHDVECLDGGGFWAVVVTFEGDVTCVRFAQVNTKQIANERPLPVPDWAPLTGGWSTSLDQTAYRPGVTHIRDHIAAGDVYQACLCRIMSHPLSDEADLASLETLVAQGNPASFASRILVPEAGLDLLSASPEAFLIRHAGRRSGSSQTSSPCRAGLTAGRSDGWMPTPVRRSLPSASVRFGRSGTPRDNGGGITWGSVPAQEWAETELKASRLIGLASGRVGL